MGFAELGESLRNSNRNLQKGTLGKYFARVTRRHLPGFERAELPAKLQRKADDKRRAAIIAYYCIYIGIGAGILILLAFVL